MRERKHDNRQAFSHQGGGDRDERVAIKGREESFRASPAVDGLLVGGCPTSLAGRRLIN